MLLRSLCLGLCALLLAAPLRADTIVVDADGDITTIQGAIDVASPGDLIEVVVGVYDGFVLNRGLTILLTPTTEVVSPILIANLPASEIAALRSGMLGEIDLRDCAGTVLIDGSVVFGELSELGAGDALLEIEACADVRLRQLGTNPGIDSQIRAARIANSRVALDGCFLDAGDGPTGQLALGGTGEDGAPALVLESGAQVDLAFSRVRAGDGGAGAFDPGAPPSGGNGGVAVIAQSGAFLRVLGNIENSLEGGRGGQGGDFFPPPCALSGDSGAALLVETGAQVRLGPEVRVEAGRGLCAVPTDAVIADGELVIPSPRDLGMSFQPGVPGLGVPGRLIHFGAPNAQALLFVGLTPQNIFIPKFGGSLLVQTDLFVNLGTFNALGERIFDVTLPATLPSGLQLYLQAASLRPDGSFHFSNTTAAVLE